jgi:hypothetical protein
MQSRLGLKFRATSSLSLLRLSLTLIGCRYKKSLLMSSSSPLSDDEVQLFILGQGGGYLSRRRFLVSVLVMVILASPLCCPLFAGLPEDDSFSSIDCLEETSRQPQVACCSQKRQLPCYSGGWRSFRWIGVDSSSLLVKLTQLRNCERTTTKPMCLGPSQTGVKAPTNAV